MLTQPWRIELFGGLAAKQGERTITRFRTHRTAALLAYLAYYRDAPQSRDFLIDLIWPDSDPEKGRMSLRTALASLRRQLEPPGAANSVFHADPHSIQLMAATVSTDVYEFESAIQSASSAQSEEIRASQWSRAVGLYSGELAAGFDDSWIQSERTRLFEVYLDCLRNLVRHHTTRQELDRAADLARLAIQADPFREDSHRALMRLYAAMGRPSAALRQYDEMEKTLRAELNTEPSRASRELADKLRERDSLGPAPSQHSRRSGAFMPSVEPANAFTEVHTAVSTGLTLPPQLTRFFGRDAEIERIVAYLAPGGASPQRRLLTLSGPGGIGKTRTALEAARRLWLHFEGGVHFVPLADVNRGHQIAPAICDALGLSRVSTEIPTERVVAALRSPALLLLDNFEQVAEEGAPVVAMLLSRAPSVSFLVTSRRRLAIPGEQELALDSLETPEADASPEELAQSPCVQLYVDRAQLVRPDFQITRGNAAAVSALCTRLEGMPLALELAAARAQVLTPAQKLDRLNERFGLLASTRGDKSSRHRSLWAAISWSYDLLSPELKSFFAKLSVFRGGWTLDAAEQIAAEPRVLEYLTQLRAHSLAITEEAGAEMRFRLLDSLREFAEAQLSEDEAVELDIRHTDYFQRLAEKAVRQIDGERQTEWMARLEHEHANLRAVLAREIERKSGLALVVSAHLWRFWQCHGYYEEGRQWLDAALSGPDSGSESQRDARAHACCGAGSLAWSQGEYDSARTHFARALELARKIGDRPTAAYALIWLGNIGYHRQDYDAARKRYQEGLAEMRELDDRIGIAYALNGLGNVNTRRDDLDKAAVYYNESLAIGREMQSTQLISYALNNLGYVEYRQGRMAESTELHKDCLRMRQDLGDKLGIAGSFESFALLAFAGGRPAKAAMLASAAARIRTELNAQMPQVGQAEQEAMLNGLRAALAAGEFERYWQDGASLSLEKAACLALS